MNKKIIVKISNGFGNQMFLYAAAYAYSKKLGYELLIDDTSGIIHDLKKWNRKKRVNWKPNYELNIFNLSSGIAHNDHKFLSLKKYLKRRALKYFDKYTLKKK